MMVRNEEDCISINIRHHAVLGVDVFFIINNGSTDSSRERLDALRHSYELHVIDIPEQSYQQSQWMTRLNTIARRHGCSLVLNLDADEFCFPTDDTQSAQGIVKKLFTRSQSLVTVPRYNMLLDRRALHSNYRFWQSKRMVEHPIVYPTQHQVEQPNIAISLAAISPKVFCNPLGLIRLKGGNHRAKHWWGWFNAITEHQLFIAHYPFRSWQHFKANVEHRQQLLETGAKMGYHYRRWVRLLEAGQLEAEFARQVFDATHTQHLQQIGVVRKYSRAYQLLKPVAYP